MFLVDPQCGWPPNERHREPFTVYGTDNATVRSIWQQAGVYSRFVSGVIRTDL
jgi:hypothetical protein